MTLIMKVLNFIFLKKIAVIRLHVFCYEDDLVDPVHLSNKKFKDCMDLLLITDKKRHTICPLNALTDLSVIGQNIGLKSTFANVCYNVKQ